MPPDLAICAFILEQSLSVRALQEMLANTMEMEVRARDVKEQRVGEMIEYEEERMVAEVRGEVRLASGFIIAWRYDSSLALLSLPEYCHVTSPG